MEKQRGHDVKLLSPQVGQDCLGSATYFFIRLRYQVSQKKNTQNAVKRSKFFWNPIRTRGNSVHIVD